jgi:hypothetical protein
MVMASRKMTIPYLTSGVVVSLVLTPAQVL